MRWILSFCLAALLWAACAGMVPAAADALPTMAGAEACAVTGDAPDRHFDQQWRAARQAIAVVTDTRWKSAPLHARLCSTRDARIFELAGAVSSPAPAVSSAPLYLRHTPLLI